MKNKPVVWKSKVKKLCKTARKLVRKSKGLPEDAAIGRDK